ncbi:MAG TPA: hypothetical protein VFR87_09985 [Nocardioidaceae bacterium]|nr:hypothetical protein [Nocardioidaceae bacterium]
MRKILILALMAFAFVLGSLSLSAASAHDDDDDDDGGLKLTAVSNQFKEFDAAPKGMSLGDYFVFSDTLWEDGDRVGSLDGFCLITYVKNSTHHEQCTVTVSLSGGQMTSQGVIVIDKDFDNKFTIAITGGTGDYKGAEGEAYVEFLSETKTSIHVNLD